jgi:hypothetical protein
LALLRAPKSAATRDAARNPTIIPATSFSSQVLALQGLDFRVFEGFPRYYT